MKKISYFNGDIDDQEYYSFNEFLPTGQTPEYQINLDTAENRQKDGNEFEEFRSFRRKNRLKKLRSAKNKKKDVFEPHPFYESLYGTPADFTGLYSSPLEYYSGSIVDSPDAAENPYMNSYQTASRKERLNIRTAFLHSLPKR